MLIPAFAATAQSGTPVAPAEWTATRSTPDEVFAIKGWAGGETESGNQSFATTFSWSVVALPGGSYRYQYEFLKSRGPRLGTFGLELPGHCEASLDLCILPGTVSASIVQLPAASFAVTTSWYDFSSAEADGIALMPQAFSGARFDFTEFESNGGGSGTGLAELTWLLSFDSRLARSGDRSSPPRC